MDDVPSLRRLTVPRSPPPSRSLRRLKKLRKCTCATDAADGDSPRAEDEEAPDEPVKARNAADEAAYFSDHDDEDGAKPEDAARGDGKQWPEPCAKCTKLFYRELDSSMRKTSRAYFAWVSRILSAAPLEESKPWWRKAMDKATMSCAAGASSGGKVIADIFGGDGVSASSSRGGDGFSVPDAQMDLHTEARECLHWIELNCTALRKILKKWDKTNHSSKGREQLRKYWNDNQYQMLYSPLILELRAVAGMLEGGEEGPHWKLDGDAEDEINGGSLDHLGGERTMLTCSICLDTLYKPVGLACGHVFCRDCLLQNAGILVEGATLRDLRADVNEVHDDPEPDPANLPAPPPGMMRRKSTKKDRCPECRHENVFQHSVRLRHVHQCLKSVDPQGYRLRKAESRQLRSKLESDARMEGLVKMLLRVAGPTGSFQGMDHVVGGESLSSSPTGRM